MKISNIIICLSVLAAAVLSRELPKGNMKKKDTSDNLMGQTRGKINELNSAI